MEGLEELRKNVDCLVIISNDKLRDIFGNLSISAAFAEGTAMTPAISTTAIFIVVDLIFALLCFGFFS